MPYWMRLLYHSRILLTILYTALAGGCVGISALQLYYTWDYLILVAMGVSLLYMSLALHMWSPENIPIVEYIILMCVNLMCTEKLHRAFVASYNLVEICILVPCHIMLVIILAHHSLGLDLDD